MKDILISVIISVGLSLLLVWLLLPSMEQYWQKKANPSEETVQVVQPTKASTEEKPAAASIDSKAITAKVNKDGWDMSYSLKNNTDEPIQNVKIRFIYYNKNGEQVHYEDSKMRVTLEPGLTHSFEHYKPREINSDCRTKIQILDYNFKNVLF